MENKSLYHWGIKGMKWGRRRYQNKDGSLTPEGKKRYADDDDRRIKESRRADVKNRRKLSDAELKSKIERIQNEKKLKELTEEDLNPGRKAVNEVLSSSGKKVAGAVLTGAALYGVKAVMTREFDAKEAASYMTPKPKNK